jgi:hypothetical protein
VQNTPNGEIWRELKRICDLVERHDKDIYRGNGKPGITTRMEKVEEALGSIKYYFRAIILLLIGLLAHAGYDLLKPR